MKKLMILGGSRYVIPVIKKAHELGLFVITCDYLPDNIAHSYSDDYVNISIVEKEKVLEVARKINIDGIISFACDPGVVTAAYVAEKLNLPSAGSYNSICILQNKRRFREFLAENGFNVPVAKGYHSVDDALLDAQLFNWPVIVKPVDSAGSKGVTKVDSVSSLKTAIIKALKISKSGEFIIEDYLEQVGYSSDTDCFSVDGKLEFVSFNAQLFDKNAENPYTPAAYFWPSLISDEKQNELTSEINRLISLLDLKTSIYNIETRVCRDGKAYIMELSPRGGGNRLAECLDYVTGSNLIENVIRSAVGFPLVKFENLHYNYYLAEIILHAHNDGVFKELYISDDLKKNVFELDL